MLRISVEDWHEYYYTESIANSICDVPFNLVKGNGDKKMFVSEEKSRRSHDYEKNWFEALAKEVLEACFPEQYHDLVIADKPDIRIDANHGIEVTRALWTDEEEINHLLDRIRNKKYEDIIDSWEYSKLEEIGAKPILSTEGKIVGIHHNNPTRIDDWKLVEALEKKVKKNYPGFDTLDLFIFAPLVHLDDWFDDETVEEFLHICKPNIFNTIYVYSGHRLFSHDYQIGMVIKKVLSEEQLTKCKKKATQIAREGKINARKRVKNQHY